MPLRENEESVLREIVKPLLAWYAVNRRPLLWRKDREPYHVWVSEIMLQQTRIEAVNQYYPRFLNALPDVGALSEASDDALLKLWEGLGYYRRARHLREAARVIMREYGGQFPHTYREWLTLPGVGEYTAGAVTSICFGEKVTAVDGNVLRVMARLLGRRDNVLLPETKRVFTRLLQAVLPEEAGDFNEALMELGETVCLPNGAPDCGNCPLASLCSARRDGLAEELPVRVKRGRRGREEMTVLLLRTDDGLIAIQKRPEEGLLSGMYQLPYTNGYPDEAELRDILAEWGLAAGDITYLREAKHAFTHLDWLMKGYLVRVAAPEGAFLWVTPEELAERFPLPTAFRYFVRDL